MFTMSGVIPFPAAAASPGFKASLNASFAVVLLSIACGSVTTTEKLPDTTAGGDGDGDGDSDADDGVGD